MFFITFIIAVFKKLHSYIMSQLVVLAALL